VNPGAVVRASRLHLPTLKEAPAEAQLASHRLLLRGGFIRQVSAGRYHVLPLGARVLSKLEALVRAEFEALGGQELRVPTPSSSDPGLDPGAVRAADRRPTEDLDVTVLSLLTALARDELRSYRQLPQLWYTLQRSLCDEARPRAGFLRLRERTRLDACAFDLADGGEQARALRQACSRLFARLSLPVVEAQASLDGATAFLVRADAGDAHVTRCLGCESVALEDVALVPRTEPPPTPESDEPAALATASGSPGLEKFATPGALTIEALVAPPHGVPAARQLKTLVYLSSRGPVVAVVRGDHVLAEPKLATASAASWVRPARPDEIRQLMGASAGSLGAVGFVAAPLFVDRDLDSARDMVTGANQDGFHLRGVDVRRDLLPHGSLIELRQAQATDRCARCGGETERFAALELGRVTPHATRLSEPMRARVLSVSGQQTALTMTSASLEIERILAAAMDRHHDEAGPLLPWPIAPFGAAVLVLGKEPEVLDAAAAVATALSAAGLHVLLDDRDERAGSKFKDVELWGIPLSVAVGKKGLAEGKVEWRVRRAGTSELLPIEGLAERVAKERAVQVGGRERGV
jgi:prolyl-tRNA synthetase